MSRQSHPRSTENDWFFVFHGHVRLYFFLEPVLNKLMNDIQNNFKCLGLLEPYCWEKGEACVVRAADTMSYRGQVIETGGGIIRVSLIIEKNLTFNPKQHQNTSLVFVVFLLPQLDFPIEIKVIFIPKIHIG